MTKRLSIMMGEYRIYVERNASIEITGPLPPRFSRPEIAHLNELLDQVEEEYKRFDARYPPLRVLGRGTNE